MSDAAVSESETTQSERSAYDQIDALNWSRLKLLDKSPAHFRLGMGDDSSAFKLGTAAHMAVLEPALFARSYEPTSVRRDARTKAWQEAETEAARRGVTLLSQSEFRDTIEIRDAVRSHARANELLSGGSAEQAMVWDLGPFKCKGRADYIGPRAIVDLKSTVSADPKAFKWSCYKYGYFGQAAWYRDGAFRSTGQRLPFYFIAVEKKPPYLVTVFRAPTPVLDYGREQYLTLLEKLDHCQRTGFWGGYTETPEIDLELPQSRGWSEEE